MFDALKQMSVKSGQLSSSYVRPLCRRSIPLEDKIVSQQIMASFYRLCNRLLTQHFALILARSSTKCSRLFPSKQLQMTMTCVARSISRRSAATFRLFPFDQAGLFLLLIYVSFNTNILQSNVANPFEVFCDFDDHPT